MGDVNTYKITSKVTLTTPEGEQPVQGIEDSGQSDSFKKLTASTECLGAGAVGTLYPIAADSVLLVVEATGPVMVTLTQGAAHVDVSLGQVKVGDDAEISDKPLVTLILTLNPDSATPLTGVRMTNEAGDENRVTTKFGSRA